MVPIPKIITQHGEILPLCTYVVAHMWQSWVEIEHYSIVYLLCSKHYSAELPLRAGLIRVALMHDKSIYVVHMIESCR